jgi:IS30 family transposase
MRLHLGAEGASGGTARGECRGLSRAVVAGFSIRAIASILGRAPSTVSREIKRNGGREGYRAARADQAAWDRGHRPKRCKLTRNRALARIVAAKLQSLWAPEQIALDLSPTATCPILLRYPQCQTSG